MSNPSRPRPDFEFLANMVPQLVWTATPDGHCDWYNQRWYEYTGLGEEESLGLGWLRAVHPEERGSCQQAWMESNRTGKAYTLEQRIRARDGAYHLHLTQACPMKDEQGRILHWFGTCTNVDEQRRLVVAKVQAQHSHYLAHELNNPLTAVTNLVYLLMHHHRLPADALPHLHTLAEQVERVNLLSRRILNNRIDAG